MATKSKGIKDGKLVIYEADPCPICGRDPHIGNIGVAIYQSGSYVVGCYDSSHKPVSFSGEIGDDLGLTIDEWNKWVGSHNDEKP